MHSETASRCTIVADCFLCLNLTTDKSKSSGVFFPPLSYDALDKTDFPFFICIIKENELALRYRSLETQL